MTQMPPVVNLEDSQKEKREQLSLSPFEKMQLAVQFVGVMSAAENSKRYERLMLISMVHVNRLEEISKLTGSEISKLISAMPVGRDS